MNKSHEKWRMIDQASKNNFFAEVNWKKNDETTNDCKIFNFSHISSTSLLGLGELL